MGLGLPCAVPLATCQTPYMMTEYEDEHANEEEDEDDDGDGKEVSDDGAGWG